MIECESLGIEGNQINKNNITGSQGNGMEGKPEY